MDPKLVSRVERWWFLFAHVLALAVGLVACYAALEHNPQGEFCIYVDAGAFANYSAQGQPCLINWANVSLLFFVWFIPASVVFFYAPFVLWRLVRLLWRLGNRNGNAAL